MNRIRNLPFAVLVTLIGTLTIIGCGDDSTTDPDGASGKIVVRMTDAPFPIDLVAEANVAIDRIELRHTDSIDGNPYIVVMDHDTTLNLMELRNGLTATLAELEVPVGSYDLVRVIVGDATIKLTDGREFDMKVPSGDQTGIKVFVAPDIMVGSGLTTELLLDFDLSKSFVVKGNPKTPAGINGFNFKPVIRAANVSTAGRVEGRIVDSASVGMENVHVVLKRDTLIYEAYTNANGSFAFIGVPAGTYSLEVMMEGYQTVTIPNLVVTAGNRTTRDATLIRM